MTYGEEIRARIDAALAGTAAARKQAAGTDDLTEQESFEAIQAWLTVVSDQLIALGDFADALHKDIHAIRGAMHPKH